MARIWLGASARSGPRLGGFPPLTHALSLPISFTLLSHGPQRHQTSSRRSNACVSEAAMRARARRRRRPFVISSTRTPCRLLRVAAAVLKGRLTATNAVTASPLSSPFGSPFVSLRRARRSLCLRFSASSHSPPVAACHPALCGVTSSAVLRLSVRRLRNAAFGAPAG